MKVWEAINILESLDPKAEVTLVLGKAPKTKEPVYEKSYVIGKDGWPSTPAYQAWHQNIIYSKTVH